MPRSVAILPLLTSLVLSTGASAQEELELQMFLAIAMVITDHGPFGQVFSGSPEDGKATLWVVMPEGLNAAGQEHYLKRSGYHGQVVFLSPDRAKDMEPPYRLLFEGVHVGGMAITGWFRTVRGRGYTPKVAPVQGSFWYPAFDGAGPARVEFVAKYPGKRQLRKEEVNGR
ncbi:MAG: hypothetical protein KIT10_05790 [Flavobacteriales bacterium]|nr:hypothetical protein [Flavobacteriales bacterium]